MYEITVSGIRCRLSLLFPAVLLYLLYRDPSGIVVFGFLASCIHEIGHILAAYFLDRPPKELTISCFGMRMITQPYTDCSALQDVWIALAGPMSNLLMYIVWCFLPVDPIYARIHLVIGILNLLPIIPLDGGRAMAALLERYIGLQHRKTFERGAFILTVIPLLAMGLLLALHPSHNISLLLVTIYLIFVRLFYNGN